MGNRKSNKKRGVREKSKKKISSERSIESSVSVVG